MIPQDSPSCTILRYAIWSFFSSIFSATLVRLLGPAARSLVAKSLVLKHQRVIVNRKPSTHWTTSAKLCGKQVLRLRKTASSLRLLRAGGMYCTPAIGIASTSKARLGG